MVQAETRTRDALPAHVLLVEDSDADVFLMRKAFAKANVPLELEHVANGKLCMQYLRGEPPYAGAKTPDLVILDLNMPVMDGRQVLAAIVEDVELRRLPVLVFTTSSADADVTAMYDMRCSGYIVKPLEYKELRRALDQICEFWFRVAEMPTRHA